MIPDLTPLLWGVFAGIGCIAGSLAAVPFLLLGIWFPACLVIGSALPLAGTVIGGVIGGITR